MLISNIVPAMATAAAVFAPAAAAWDMKLKWQSKTTCSDSGGPARTYSRNECIPLSESSHGVTILEHNAPCKSKREPNPHCLCWKPCN